MTPFIGTPDYEHGTAGRVGVLLVNLGTPDEPSTVAVRRYLAEFLWDPRVIEMPRVLWWLILHGYILRVRPGRSAHAYQKIWTKRGSPLLIESQDLADALGARLRRQFGDRVVVDLAMTYGRPAIHDVLENFRRRNVQRLIVLPLYPQYSVSATQTVLDLAPGLLDAVGGNGRCGRVRHAWRSRAAAPDAAFRSHGLRTPKPAGSGRASRISGDPCQRVEQSGNCDDEIPLL
jgi:hypothetical protein